MARRSRARTDISLWDRVKLKHELLSRPAFVLRHFGPCQIESLDQLEMYQEILRENSDAAARICETARQMGIPEHLDTLLDEVDVLGEEPGSV